MSLPYYIHFTPVCNECDHRQDISSQLVSSDIYTHNFRVKSSSG